MEEKRGLEAKSKLYNQWEKEILQENKGVTWSNFFVLMVEKIEKVWKDLPRDTLSIASCIVQHQLIAGMLDKI